VSSTAGPGTGAGSANGTVPGQRAVPAASLTGPIVALGDSYTAGNLVPLLDGSIPVGCFRSSVAYPRRVAAALHDAAGLVDAACSGAGTADMTAPQATSAGTNPPQLDSVTASDSLVVLSLGGDDTGFLNVLRTCIRLSWTNPFGSPCKRHYAGSGTDQLAARVTGEAPKMAAVLEAIRAKAPNARVLLVGYLDLFPMHGGCWPAVPITDGDIAYLRGIELRLNAMLATEAAATGVTFVDTYDATIGHDFCQRSSARDVEGLLPATLTAPFHPNSRGQAAIATQVLAAVG
jgi:lysophospholipase L1-like esterase